MDAHDYAFGTIFYLRSSSSEGPRESVGGLGPRLVLRGGGAGDPGEADIRRS